MSDLAVIRQALDYFSDHCPPCDAEGVDGDHAPHCIIVAAREALERLEKAEEGRTNYNLFQEGYETARGQAARLAEGKLHDRVTGQMTQAWNMALMAVADDIRDMTPETNDGE